MAVKTESHVPVLERTVQHTHEWLRDMKDAAQLETQDQAYSALRAVLHTLRDRLTNEEAAHLSAQLPMLIRGVYFEGWRPAAAPEKSRHAEDFLDHVRTHMGNDICEPERAVKAAFLVLEEHITGGEAEHVKQMLPEDVRNLWPSG